MLATETRRCDGFDSRNLRQFMWGRFFAGRADLWSPLVYSLWALTFSIPVMVRYGPYLSVNNMLWFVNDQDTIRPVIPNETR